MNYTNNSYIFTILLVSHIPNNRHLTLSASFTHNIFHTFPHILNYAIWDRNSLTSILGTQFTKHFRTIYTLNNQGNEKEPPRIYVHIRGKVLKVTFFHFYTIEKGTYFPHLLGVTITRKLIINPWS